MEIQWTLVIFTALTGMAGWMAACIAIDEFRGPVKKSSFIAALVAAILAVLGGIASVCHLAHPTRMLSALAHPTSGIFIEAVLVGLAVACLISYMILFKKNGNARARKVFIVSAAIFGVLLSFMAGESYMMSSRPVWNTFLLPLGYLGTAIPMGIVAYLVIISSKKDEATIKLYGIFLLIGAIIGVVTAGVYVLASGSMVDCALLFWICCVFAGIITIICGFMIAKKPAAAMIPAVIAVCCSTVVAIAYRCIMWIVSVPINDFLNMI